MKRFAGAVPAMLVGKLMPKCLVWVFAKPFIAGKNLDEALIKVIELNQSGFSVSFDYIGEDTRDFAALTDASQTNLRCVEVIDRKKLNADVSTKLSQFGIFTPPHLTSIHLAYHGLHHHEFLVQEASYRNIRVWLDAERYEARERTWYIGQRLGALYRNIGIRIQAYFEGAPEFLEERLKKGWKGAIGVCRGAYDERGVVLLTGDALLENFVALCKIVKKYECFLQVDTHDEALIFQVESEVIPDEYGMLRGVNTSLAGKLRTEGKRVRIYTPYGQDVRGYVSRRIIERPQYTLLPAKTLFQKLRRK